MRILPRVIELLLISAVAGVFLGGCYRPAAKPPGNGTDTTKNNTTKKGSTDTDKRFRIALDVQVEGKDEAIHASASLPRPVVSVKPGDVMRVHWSVASRYPGGTIPNVTVHFFLAAADKLGQRDSPELGADTVNENAYTMDFEPREESSAKLVLPAPATGIYQMRVQTVGVEPGEFAALDVQVQ